MMAVGELGRAAVRHGRAADDVVWLGDLAAHDPGRVGGKAANLSRLAGRWPVPPGFCITAATYRRAIETERGRSVRTLRRLIGPPYRELAARSGRRRPAAAVRSSAVDEDGAVVSFAGQYDTVLNAIGPRAVAAALATCWQSASSPRVRAYRAAHDLPEASVAVLVQQLVDTAVAAVVFSVDPVEGNRDEILINASWGLGDAIVAGTVTPDTYRVSRDRLRLVDAAVADKDVMIVRNARATRQIPVPADRRSRPALTTNQAVELARLAVDLETDMGWPVDLECAYDHDGRLHLLQCRPITALPAVS